MKISSYIFTGPAGTFLFEGADRSDEVFNHIDLGVINVTRLLRDFPFDESPIQFPLDAGLKKHIAEKEFDFYEPNERILSKLDTPVLFTLLDGVLHMVDGAHRTRERIRKGLPWVMGYILDPAVFEYFRVKAWRIESDGSRMAWDPIRLRPL